MIKWISRPIAASTLLVSVSAVPRVFGPVLPKAAVDQDCDAQDSDDDAIVVCRKRNPGTQYRIPEELRDAEAIDSAHSARLANERDSRSADSYGSQTIGPFGYVKRARQATCEWRVEHQKAQGRQPDCTRKEKKDDPADWERGTTRR